MITYIESDELIDKVKEYDATLIAANIYATMSDGIAEDVRQRFPYVYQTNIRTKYGDSSLLGTIIESTELNEPTFILCYITKIKKKNSDYVNYDALQKVLQLVNARFKGKHIATTLLGVDKFEGNGNSDRIKILFEKYLTNLDVDVYLFKQDSHLSKWAKAIKASQQYKNDKDKWEKFIIESKKKITKSKNENTTRTNKRPFKTYSVLLNKK